MCDGHDFGTDNCEAHGQYAGVLTCSAGCLGVTLEHCGGSCGDGEIDGVLFRCPHCLRVNRVR